MVLPAKLPYLYQKLNQKATELHLLGMSYNKIGKTLGIDPKTAKKAIEQKKRGHPSSAPFFFVSTLFMIYFDLLQSSKRLFQEKLLWFGDLLYLSN